MHKHVITNTKNNPRLFKSKLVKEIGTHFDFWNCIYQQWRPPNVDNNIPIVQFLSNHCTYWAMSIHAISIIDSKYKFVHKDSRLWLWQTLLERPSPKLSNIYLRRDIEVLSKPRKLMDKWCEFLLLRENIFCVTVQDK
jgi:hypothetical protein